ncbi:hypothetical protein [Mesorhizobium ventifaucium]|uniref:Uncharacterized protein n=1 Tax=Mesorhizobium ventifaucium TaxID=666020 RepID=A0ABN8JP33_9HYPH|nr:hypothetical protein [Mesorhizobium ventifaucium]CAH2399817.1 hypothetical protein MES4922_220073 [Mesorhizobium ventifaucium]
MFERIRNSVFWHDKFDQTWQHNSMFLKLPDIGWRRGRRIDEKKAYWRVHGKRMQLSPSQAVYRAFEDIADTIFVEHDNKERMEATWVELAQALYYAAGTADWEGPYVSAEQRLSPRWQPYYQRYRAKRPTAILMCRLARRSE